MYKPRTQWEPSRRSLWLWRAFLALILTVLLAIGSYLQAAVFTALCVVGEVLRLRA